MFHHHHRDNEVTKVLLITLGLNIVVSIAKLIYGYMTKSLSLVADGFHSLFDSSSNIVAMVGLYFAAKPADEGHPYGHRKIETFSSLFIAVLLYATCFHIISEVIQRIKNPVVPEITSLSFGIMIVTMAINLFVAIYESKKAHEHKSDLLHADSVHTKTDIFVSLSVIASFIAVLLNYPVLDIVIACIIVLFIFKAAYKIVSKSLNVLLDAQLLDVNEIASLVKTIEGIDDCHKIRSRGSASNIFVDLHIHVDPLMTLENAHNLTHEVIHRLKSKYPDIVDVLIHTEPTYLTQPDKARHLNLTDH